MKPYGHRRKDAKTCRYGCCGYGKANVENRWPSNRVRVNRAARKRGRRWIQEDLMDRARVYASSAHLFVDPSFCQPRD
jgi:hypothetical protein